MQNTATQILEKGLTAICEATEHKSLELVKAQYLGKTGELNALLKQLGQMSPDERKTVGAHINECKTQFQAAYDAKRTELDEAKLQARLAAEALDITLPARTQSAGGLHPVTLTLQRVVELFHGMGFDVADGPEIEDDYYNFQCLNFPDDHPARDMQDSMYITDKILLRTHTSPMQARTLQAHEPNEPVKVIVPGKVYRWDYDATHSPVFHQMEGLIVDEHIRFSDLKGMLEDFLREIFGPQTKVRFRASFFPFTEPSAEVDISCVMCGGEGCRVCSHTGWLEILGCGMVHPNVLRLNGYDPDKVNGFAFGMGVERIAMLKYGIDDLRLFYENDMRFLNQF